MYSLMYPIRCLYNSSFRCKLYAGLIVVILYLLTYSRLHLSLLYKHGFNADYYHHSIGKIIANQNGSFLYFHLPSLNDYNIEKDFFQINSLYPGHKVNISQNLCLRKGSEIDNANLVNSFFCICRDGYSGKDCSVPKFVQKTIDSNSVKISRLKKPRRILISLIWITYNFDNVTNQISRFDQFVKTLDRLSQFTDFFVIHEIILKSNNNNVSSFDQHTLDYQFNNGILKSFKSFTLLFARTIQYNELDQFTLNLYKLELDLTKQSWNIFTNRVTEYRPSDLLIFLSINNFAKEELLLFLKHYTVLSDLIQLKPVNLWSLENGQFRTTPIDSVVSSNPNSNIIPNRFPKLSMVDGQLSNRMKNTIVTFEYISFLCRYNFDHFLTNYCLSDNDLIEHFEHNFWAIRFVNIGNSNFTSVFSIN